MTQITLTPEQAAAIAAADGMVALRRPDGTFVGWISPNTNFVIPNEIPFTPEEIAAAEKDAETDGPWSTTREVMDHLQSLADDQQ
jgi:hypothetical protein